MKHSHLINLSCQSFTKPHAMLSAIIMICLVTTSCRKMEISAPENARELQASISTMNNNMMLEKIILNDSIVKLRTQNNLKQMTLATINNADGSFKKEMAYEYDPQGRLYLAVENGIWRTIYEKDRFGIIIKSSVYKMDSVFTSFGNYYEYNANGDLANCKLYGSNTTGSNGRDILIGGLGYDYNTDGTIRSIKIYDYKDSKEPVGKVDFYINATPLQVAAWKEIAGSFPEPEKPWEVLTMLCNRIEMYGYGSVAAEKIIDGKILTAGNFVFSEEGVLLSKVVNSKTADLISQGSTQIASSSNSFGVEYKYVPVRR